jgi:hypothetical protein
LGLDKRSFDGVPASETLGEPVDKASELGQRLVRNRERTWLMLFNWDRG